MDDDERKKGFRELYMNPHRNDFIMRMPIGVLVDMSAKSVRGIEDGLVLVSLGQHMILEVASIRPQLAE